MLYYTVAALISLPWHPIHTPLDTPLSLDISYILLIFPSLSLFISLSFTLSLSLSAFPSLQAVGGRPMMSSCHREDQGERPPGVWNALFFPVVFRKVAINLIPPSSLPDLRGAEEARREGGTVREPEEEDMTEEGWGHSWGFPKGDASNIKGEG